MTYAERPVRQIDSRLVLGWGLLVVTLVPWRMFVFYTGGVDPTVLGKAAVALAAFVLGWWCCPPGLLAQLSTRTWILVVMFLGIGLVGSVAGGQAVSSAVLAVRMVLMVSTVSMLLAARPVAITLNSLAVACAVIAVVLSISGFPALIRGDGPQVTVGRLAPALLAVSPNELALLLGIPLLILVWHTTTSELALWQVVGGAGLLGLTWLTGSRTGLAALAVGCVVMLLRAPRLNLPSFAGFVVAVPAAFYFFFFTDSLASYFGRGGTQNLLSLNSRTIAWQAAFSEHRDLVATWFGGGLGIKTVPVAGAYWQSQVIDSSWVSAFVQAGVLGVLTLAVLVVTVFVGTASDHSREGRLLLGLSTYTVLRSFTETGLLDTDVLALLLLVASFAIDLHRGRREQQGDKQGQGESESQPADDIQHEVAP